MGLLSILCKDIISDSWGKTLLILALFLYRTHSFMHITLQYWNFQPRSKLLHCPLFFFFFKSLVYQYFQVQQTISIHPLSFNCILYQAVYLIFLKIKTQTFITLLFKLYNYSMPSYFFPSKSHHRSFIKQHQVVSVEHSHQKTNRSLTIRKNENPIKYSSLEFEQKSMSKSYDLNSLWSHRSKPSKERIKAGMKSSKNNRTLEIRGFQKEPSFPNKINTQCSKQREIRTMHTRRFSIDSPFFRRYKEQNLNGIPPQKIFDKAHPREKATKDARPFTGWQINYEEFGEPF